MSQLPDEVPPGVDPDYMVEPVEVDTSVETVIGVVSLVLVAVGATVLVVGVRRGTLDRRWLGVLAALAAVAAYAGVTYAVVTSPVVGANIGGGLLVLAAVPFVVTMLVVAAVAARRR